MDAAVLVDAAGASHHCPHAPFEVDLWSAPVRTLQSARQNVADPVQASRHSRVDPWIVRVTASQTPRGHPGNDESIAVQTNKWATAISLACIHHSSPRCASSTDHGVRHCPVGLRVIRLTTVVRDGGHDGLLEDAGQVTPRLLHAPASDLAHAPDTLEVVTRQAGRSDAAGLWYRSIQLKQREIAVKEDLLAERRMRKDLRDATHLRGLGCWFDMRVLLPAACDNLELGELAVIQEGSAVRRSEDPPVFN
mmetsp:Transcript_100119/g.238664  ORF Transcript_100119/g.238664 Transcript_100119/m.238664 type:complete len:250 (-) Transcript_100119:318-1067(-)|eukprot:CAMPEP_0181418986 /NCGR_PEP_ID=MMETSP1110-20121109/11842_1 /TAXON_ID=174948 /ORGANISM="Symbiodinium sp., Strain CCMP421" /LENGTH=249 /DNA_ID=CAMNT_0023541991 /DNA_START=227 /DNA_END=976 /DNA_ORIENTATION=+